MRNQSDETATTKQEKQQPTPVVPNQMKKMQTKHKGMDNFNLKKKSK